MNCKSEFKLKTRLRNRKKMHSWSGFDTANLSKSQSTKIRLFLIDLFLAYKDASVDELISRSKSAQQKKFASAPLGEHYRLLSALVRSRQMTRVVEIGTSTGMSALQLFTAGAQVDTFDLVPWRNFQDTVLLEEDFSRGFVKQHIGNLLNINFFQEKVAEFQSADLIFIDGPKDFVFEAAILQRLLSAKLKSGCLIILDDIYFTSMVALWQSIQEPHFDVSIIGHASGTGLIFPNSFFD